MTCTVRDCGKPLLRYGLCKKHYRRRLGYGVIGRVDAGPVIERISVLRDLGWTFAQIGEAAGLSRDTLASIMRRRAAKVGQRTHDALMRVTVERIESSRRVDATGTHRRVQALNALGWPSRVLAERLGMHPRTFVSLAARPTVGVWFELRVQKLYAELEFTRGPSKFSVTRARTLKLAPPAAWDDIDIEDPAAEPEGIRGAA